jgi:hypothetical protein
MNTKEVERKLKAENVPGDCYSIMKGGLPNEAYCLNAENGAWVVYYSERGNRSGLTVFRTESEACTCLYNKVKRYGRK